MGRVIGIGIQHLMEFPRMRRIRQQGGLDEKSSVHILYTYSVGMHPSTVSICLHDHANNPST